MTKDQFLSFNSEKKNFLFPDIVNTFLFLLVNRKLLQKLIYILMCYIINLIDIFLNLGLVWFEFWHINHYRLFNAKFIFIHIKTSISNSSV